MEKKKKDPIEITFDNLDNIVKMLDSNSQEDTEMAYATVKTLRLNSCFVLIMSRNVANWEKRDAFINAAKDFNPFMHNFWGSRSWRDIKIRLVRYIQMYPNDPRNELMLEYFKRSIIHYLENTVFASLYNHYHVTVLTDMIKKKNLKDILAIDVNKLEDNIDVAYSKFLKNKHGQKENNSSGRS
ncbi:MAG: hypothetical protein HRT87_06745 [Legionellales bacterium]|nr:hypothetical protein [Legionellales bacterium]